MSGCGTEALNCACVPCLLKGWQQAAGSLAPLAHSGWFLAPQEPWADHRSRGSSASRVTAVSPNGRPVWVPHARRPHVSLLCPGQVKRLRLEREREKAMREQELEMLQREKEAEHFKTWEEQEDNFHLQQAKLR